MWRKYAEKWKRTGEADEPENVQGNLIWKRKSHAEGVATGQLPF